MPGPATVEDLNEHVDDLAGPMLFKLYTQLCFCYSLADDSSDSAITDTLMNGLDRLSTSFPWLAGQVVREASGDCTFKIKPSNNIPCLVVKDFRHDPSTPTMNALRRANFPFSMLDESIIAPCKTLSASSGDSASDPAPVFLLQASFIKGGLLITFVGQHITMDMIGQGQVIRLLSKACRNEQFTSEDISSGNLPRHNLIPLLDDSYKQCSELARQIVKPLSSQPGQPISKDANSDSPPDPPPNCTWAYFNFPTTSLTALKSLAGGNITNPPGYISTDDVLSAFIWQSVVRARLTRLNLTSDSTLARAVDVRRYLDIPDTYTGHMQNMTYHKYTLQKLVEEPLGAVASQLRLAVDPETSDLAYKTRALATLFNRTADKANISPTAMLDLSADIMISSWAKVDCCELDFNLGLCKPEAVRRPRFDPYESLIYLMPRTLGGEIAIGICLRDEDMEKLRADEQFAMYAMYIG